jgi:TolA-binding protein
LEQNNGQALLRYIRQCDDHKAWSQVVLMSQYVLRLYPDGPTVPEVMFKYSEGLVEIDQPLEAIAVLNGMVSSFPNNIKAADAYSRIGSIYYDDLNDPVKALASFESTLKLPSRGTEYLSARKGIPYCYLRLGRLDEASEEFEGLRKLKLNEDISEEVDYNLALIKLYEKQYDSAEVALRKLMVDHPRGFYVNDALQLILLVGEVKESKDLLYDYSNALYFEQRLMYDSARVRLKQLSDGENRTAADIALFRLSELEFRYHDTTAALAAVDRLIADFPDSYYRPHGIKARADVLVLDVETREEAVALYTQLLQDYPNYPFISEVRKRLRGFKISHKIG